MYGNTALIGVAQRGYEEVVALLKALPKCVICLELMNPKSIKTVHISRNCKHKLHAKCKRSLMSHANVNSVCPVCRCDIIN